jgi:hypothetical protein
MTKIKPVPAAAPTNKPRGQVMRDYAINQRERGCSQVKVWMPANMVEWLHQIADEARKLHAVGLDPMERVPATLLKGVGPHA